MVVPHVNLILSFHQMIALKRHWFPILLSFYYIPLSLLLFSHKWTSNLSCFLHSLMPTLPPSITVKRLFTLHTSLHSKHMRRRLFWATCILFITQSSLQNLSLLQAINYYHSFPCIFLSFFCCFGSKVKWEGLSLFLTLYVTVWYPCPLAQQQKTSTVKHSRANVVNAALMYNIACFPLTGGDRKNLRWWCVCVWQRKRGGYKERKILWAKNGLLPGQTTKMWQWL